MFSYMLSSLGMLSRRSKLIIHSCKATSAKQMDNSQKVSIEFNRLAWLGDSVLRLATSVYLYNTRPHNSNGELAVARDRLVSNYILSYLGKKKGITCTMQSTYFEKLRLLPPGYEAASKEFYKIISLQNIQVADIVEALIGAHTLTGGLIGGINLMKWLGVMICNDSVPTLHTHVPHTQSILFADSSQIFSSYFGSPPPPSLTVSDKERHSIMSEMSSIEKGLQYTFKNKLLLIDAMTHSSYTCDGTLKSRLKFLGDAILDYLVTCHVHVFQQEFSSVRVHVLKSAIFRDSCFAELAVSLNLHKCLRHNSPQLLANMTSYRERLEEKKNEELGIKFEEISMNSDEVGAESLKGDDDMTHPPKSLRECFVSLAGAVFIDSGMNLQTVWKTFSPLLEPLFEKFKCNVPMMPVLELNHHDHNMTVKKKQVAPIQKFN
ncbi:PREDICTED: endoribonuclease Dicer-like [Amphimedon queenslandica]|uniref:RNase III domain-containing protein n=1 Tax=Amphimedon queenslandica TaxID=400682 RepID=A0AAN0JD81_AMPQE|nr:PREDICTED: endoribonuclease Dicer-like [Amphimedon queenslandica]|eukprot:XP_019854673.1 PREDICTED: endoribonuclease Dicer-like [Amphimedon queenslandica]